MARKAATDNKDNTTALEATKPQPMTGRGGKYNFPSTVKPEDPDTVRAALGSVIYWMQRGRDAKPITDDEIQARCDEYITTCYETGQRMTVEKLALALGITRETLHQWETGRISNARRTDIIKRAKDMIASYDADMVTAGKMRDAPYIFRAINYYGMRQAVDMTVAPAAISDRDPGEIRRKYAELPEE